MKKTVIHTILALLATFSCTNAQYGTTTYQYQRPQPLSPPNFTPNNCRGSCSCSQEYIPFCATDGRQETTYSNKCELLCAQRQCPNLRIKFEGVCAKPYQGGGGRPVPPQRPVGYGSGSQSSWLRPPPSISPPNRYPPGSGFNRPTTPPPRYPVPSRPTSRPSYGSSGYQPQLPQTGGYQPQRPPPQTESYQPQRPPPQAGGYQPQFPQSGGESWQSTQPGFRYPQNHNNGARPVSAGYGSNTGFRRNRDADYDDYAEEED